jgi:cytoskeletal protein RodZ
MSADSHTPPTRPSAFGAELRRLRDAAGISLEEIMTETKISRRILESLERGRFQYLPERVFSRNFVRQYACLIGFDEDKLVAWFDEAWERFQLASGSYHAIEVDVETPTPPIRWHFWIPIGLAILIVAVVAVLIGRSSTGSLDLDPDPRRALSTVVPPPSTPTGVPPTPLTSGANPETTTAASEEVRLTVTVAESRECWLHYRDRDGRTGERLLTAGGSVDLELSGPAVVTLGNAGAVVVHTAGHSYSELGGPGEVLHLEISAEGIRRLGRGEVNVELNSLKESQG